MGQRNRAAAHVSIPRGEDEGTVISQSIASRWAAMRYGGNRTRDTPALYNVAAVVVLLGVTLTVWSTLFGRYAIDDSFIGYANAQNLSHGRGFAFNPGDRLLTTSAPLVIPLYAVVEHFFGVEVVRTAQWLSATSYLVIGIISFQLGKRLTSNIAGALGSAFVFMSSPMVVLMWSHETLIWIALVLVGIELAFQERVRSASFVLGLSALVRPETLLIVPFVSYILCKRNSTIEILRCAGLLCLPFAAWAIYAIPEFGSPISESVAAKHAQLLTSGRPYLNGFFTTLTVLYASAIPAPLFAIASCAATFALVLPFACRQWEGPVVAIVGWAALMFVFYISAQVHFFVWFGLQAAVLAAAAVAFPVRLIERRCEIGSGRPRPLLYLGAVSAVVIVLAHAWFLASLATNASFTKMYANIMIMPRLHANNYYRLAQFVRDHTRTTDSVAYPEIGQLRYYSGRRIIDYNGLATPGVATHALDANTIWAFERYRPDVFADAVGYWQFIVAPLEYPWFAKAYVRGESATFEPVQNKARFVLYHLRNAAAIPAPEEIDRNASITVSDAVHTTFSVSSKQRVSAVDVRVDGKTCSAGRLSLHVVGEPDLTAPIETTAFSRVVLARIDVPWARRVAGRSYRLRLEHCPLTAVRAPLAIRSGFILWNPVRHRGGPDTAINVYFRPLGGS